MKENVKSQIRSMCEMFGYTYQYQEAFIEFVYNKHLSGFSGENIQEAYEEYVKIDKSIVENVLYKDKVNKYVITLSNFKRAWNEFSEFIDDANNLDFNEVVALDEYPFAESFDELTFNVIGFIDSSIAKLKKEVDK